MSRNSVLLLQCSFPDGMVRSFWCGGNAGSATQDLSLKDEIADVEAIVTVCRAPCRNRMA